jgi:hypothetical protein
MTSRSVGEPLEPGIGQRSPLAVAGSETAWPRPMSDPIRDIPEVAELTKFENVQTSLRPVGARLHQPYNPDHPQAPNRPRPGRSYRPCTHFPQFPDTPIVISSIMRRRRGLISVIGGSCLWVEQPKTLSDRRPLSSKSAVISYRAAVREDRQHAAAAGPRHLLCPWRNPRRNWSHCRYQCQCLLCVRWTSVRPERKKRS